MDLTGRRTNKIPLPTLRTQARSAANNPRERGHGRATVTERVRRRRRRRGPAWHRNDQEHRAVGRYENTSRSDRLVLFRARLDPPGLRLHDSRHPRRRAGEHKRSFATVVPVDGMVRLLALLAAVESFAAAGAPHQLLCFAAAAAPAEGAAIALAGLCLRLVRSSIDPTPVSVAVSRIFSGGRRRRRRRRRLVWHVSPGERRHIRQAPGELVAGTEHGRPTVGRMFELESACAADRMRLHCANALVQTRARTHARTHERRETRRGAAPPICALRF